jgi:transposase InsO family protein
VPRSLNHANQYMTQQAVIEAINLGCQVPSSINAKMKSVTLRGIIIRSQKLWDRLTHIRGAPYHPMTQGKIERYHLSMKNVVKLQNFYFPWELEQTIKDFVTYYNHERYHESLDNMTLADVYFGTVDEVKSKREGIKQETIEERRQQHRQGVQDRLYWSSESSLILRSEMSH